MFDMNLDGKTLSVVSLYTLKQHCCHDSLTCNRQTETAPPAGQAWDHLVLAACSAPSHEVRHWMYRPVTVWCALCQMQALKNYENWFWNLPFQGRNTGRFFFFQSGKERKLNFRTKARGSLCAGRVLLCYTSFRCQRCNLSCALWVGVSPDWTVKPGVSRRPSPGSGIRSRPRDTECIVLTSQLFFFLYLPKNMLAYPSDPISFWEEL